MKLGLFTVFSALFLFCSAQKSSDFDQQLTERNLLYNDLQAAKINDTVLPEQLSVHYESIISIDNVLLDEWIPLMLMNNDSLSQAILSQKTEHQIAMAELKEKHDLFFYAAVGTAGLILILLIIVIVQAVSKAKLKKKVGNSAKLKSEIDELKSTAEQYDHQMDEAKLNKEELEKKVQQFVNQIEEKEKEKNTEVSNLNNRISELQKNLDSLSNEKQTEISALQQQLLQTQQVEDNDDCIEHEQRIKDMENLIENQRDEFLTTQREKEVLIDDLRAEIHILRTKIDETERDDSHERFSEVSDVIDENTKLKQKADELKDILDDYRQTLEKELEMRKELEQMLKDIIQK